MANKKISELDVRSTLGLSDLLVVGDPSTGYAYKTTINDLKTITGAGVISFNGRVGAVVPVEGDYSFGQLSDVIITTATSGQYSRYNGTNWVNSAIQAGDIPDIGATYVTLATAQTISGEKTFTNNVRIDSGSSTKRLILDADNNVPRIFSFRTDDTQRWAIRVDGDETGSNAGADFSIRRYNDAGTFVDAPIQITRSNGAIRINHDITMYDDGVNNGDSRKIYFRALGDTGQVQTAYIALDGYDGTNGEYLQLSSSNIRLSPTTGNVSIVGTNPTVSTTSANGIRLLAYSTTNGIKLVQGYNQTSGDLFSIFNNSNSKKFSIAASDSTVTVSSLSGTGSRMVVADANGVLSTQAINAGTVTSVGLSLPNIFTVTGSPVTGSGTLTATLANQNANVVFAGPSTGSAAAPTFRSLVAADIPALAYVPTSRTLTINGTALDLSADRSWSVGTVTSVGLSTGTTGTDVNVSGSPITGSGSITLNIPDASATARGLITTGVQTIAGEKTFTGKLIVSNSLNEVASFESPNANTWVDLKSTTATWSIGSTSANSFEVYTRSTTPMAVKLRVGVSASQFFTTLEATQFIRTGGTSSQFLKADGSIDSNTYVTGGPYLPLAGGTTTGAIRITSNAATDSSGLAIGIANNYAVRWRNAANTDNLGIYLSASNEWTFDTAPMIVNGILSAKGSTNSVDSIRFYNTDGNYGYIRTTAATNANNIWFDGHLGSTTWINWYNPGQLTTANTYSTVMIGTGRGTESEKIEFNRGRIYQYNSSGTNTITLDGLNGRVGIGMTTTSDALSVYGAIITSNGGSITAAGMISSGSTISSGLNIIATSTISGSAIIPTGTTAPVVGMYLVSGTSTSNGVLGFSTGTTKRLEIGTTGAATFTNTVTTGGDVMGSLSAIGSTSSNFGIKVDNTYTTTAAGTASVFLYNNNVLKVRYEYARDLDSGIIGTAANIPMLFFTNNTSKMKLNSGGNLEAYYSVLANSPSEGATGEGLIAGRSFKIDATGSGQSPKMYIVANTLSDTYGSGLQIQAANTGNDKGFGFNLTTGGTYETYVKQGSGSWLRSQTITKDGYVSFPEQPALLAQPDSSTTFTTTGGAPNAFGWNTSGGIRFNNGFTFSAATSATYNVANAANRGKITVPAAGKYLINISIRNETEKGSSGQLYCWVNGTVRVRRHIELWDFNDYIHADATFIVDLAANDYLEFGAWWNAAGVNGQIQGTGDTVNWLSIVKVK